MAVYFCFGDEGGDYKTNSDERFVRNHPYYTRSIVIMKADDYLEFSRIFKSARASCKLPEGEIKWSYIWSIKKCQENEYSIKDSKPYSFLKDIEYERLVEFCEHVLRRILRNIEMIIIFSITDNSDDLRYSEKDSFIMHTRTFLQRIQFEIQHKRDNIGVVFFDPLDDNKSKLIRNCYHEIYSSGVSLKNTQI